MLDRGIDDPVSESDFERDQAFKSDVKRNLCSSVVVRGWLGLLGLRLESRLGNKRRRERGLE